ncbi:MAG: putative toxin-antitoxin system toxin component, PIN family [Leptospiraceae bacterium]|nr:putative toxin-antitoxin system toxin component, PIN family [Leptospiraceae bacterium]
MKIFIDTNVWISYFLSRTFGNLESILSKKEIKIYTSLEQIDELERVLRYPKLKKYFSEEAIIDILKFVSEKSNVVSIKRIIQDCRDPEDNYILDIGTQFHLDYIITGDEDLLALHPYKKIQVIKIAKFIEMAL